MINLLEFKMEIIYHKGIKYSTKCPECFETIKFEINTHEFNISAICKNDHKYDNLSFTQFNNRCIRETNYSYIKCYRCYSLINEQFQNFICEGCKKIFCNKCIKFHSKVKSHHIRSYYINKNKQCQLHHKGYDLFCDSCKVNICQECKNEHKNHFIKSYADIIPNKNKIESIKNQIKMNNQKFENIIKEIEDYKKDFDIRYEKIINFINFLKKSLIDKLLKEFNYSFIDYYNYENLNYCINYLNNEDIIKNNNYLKYLIFGNKTNKKEEDNYSTDEEIQKYELKEKKLIENKEIYNINNYNSLKFLYGKNIIKYMQKLKLLKEAIINYSIFQI